MRPIYMQRDDARLLNEDVARTKLRGALAFAKNAHRVPPDYSSDNWYKTALAIVVADLEDAVRWLAPLAGDEAPHDELQERADAIYLGDHAEELNCGYGDAGPTS